MKRHILLDIYILSLTCASLFLLFLFLYHIVFSLDNIPLTGIMSFIILTVLAELLPVRVSAESLITVSPSIIFASILIFGYRIATVIAAFGVLINMLIEYKRYSIKKIFFNTSMYALMTAASGYVLWLMGFRSGNIDLTADFLPMSLSVLIYLLSNILLFSVVLTLSQQITVKQIWIHSIRSLIPNYLALAPLGILLAFTYINMGIPGLLLLFIPLMVARHTFKLYMEMRSIYLEAVQALAAAIEVKDPYTKGHSERVAKYAVAIAREMKYPEDKIETLQYAALLHDIGKIGIDKNILNKPDKLSKEEFNKIKDHAVLGANIVQRVNFLSPASKFILHHHERADGSGYPLGFRGNEIPKEAAILAVADVFDALTSDRPYRRAMSRDEALKLIKEKSGVEFDPEVVEALLRVIKKGEIFEKC
ncbi:MAG: hypothetical protein PWQ82_1011 [Thermosediminibacterales bacterium]|nr:hypothetical protein [Thermosediminibacterales bacterium]MDK2836197.1 hypothetical protein [Thermosediminibacterales bacterium]